MSSSDTKRALDILDGVHGLSERELESYLDRVCGENSLLRREVLSYLEHDVEGTVLNGGAGDGTVPEIPVTTSSETRYELGGEIACGGMGVVLRAFDRNIHRDVAVKVLRSEWEDKPDTVRRFLQEAQIGGQLQHPGIAPVYEIGRLSDGRPFIAMKLVKGDTLGDLLAHRRKPAEDQAKFLGIFEQVCQTIAFAHRRGVIHRDLKPSNVMVGEFGEVQVMDWGIAKVLTENQPEAPKDDGLSQSDVPASDPVNVDTDGSGYSTRVGQLMGTPAYMAPEQSIGRADTTADVFSLGVILCEILTSENTTGRVDAAYEHLDRCPCDQELVQLAKDCLQQREGDRPQNAGAVAARLSARMDALQSRLRTAEIAAARAEVKAEEERKRRRRTLWTITAVAVLLLMVGLAVLVVRRISLQRGLRERTKTTVTALSTSYGILVPRVIEDLQELPSEMVLPELRRQFNAADEIRKLRLAYGLAEFGDVRVDHLVSQVASASPEEVDNFVQALRNANGEAVSVLEAAAQMAETKENWRHKARMAMLTLQLNAPELATGMCQPRANPIQRSLFVEECSTWHGSLSQLAPLVESVDDRPFRSAIAMAVGSVPAMDLTASDRQTWQTVLSNWYQMQPDTGIHSAAGWALRNWNLELPKIIASKQPHEKCHWYVNSIGMTMLKLPAGSFVREAESATAAIEQQVIVPDAFLLADCEVTRAQFQQFVDDPQYSSEEKPTYWEGASFRTSPTEQHPVQLVTWYDAVLFCNWLSRKEGLTPCYERTGQKEKRKNAARAYDAWRPVADASGYRLPTEAEWEYACRAGSETSFHFADDESLLHRYAVHHSGGPAAPCGSKLPNAWGFFDVHGNVREWCQDWDRELVGDVTRRSPHAVTDLFRALRGGSMVYGPSHLHSAARVSTQTDSISDVSGFRAARTFP